jgi:hypothetical protein
MPKNTKTPLGLLINTISDGDFFHIHLSFVMWEDGNKVRNASTRYEPVNGLQLLDNLQITSQGNNSDRVRLYGWEVRYRDVFAVDLRDAGRMHATLKKIQAGLDKLTAKRGYAATYGEFVGRVAEVTGVTTILTYRNRGRYASYDESTFTKYSVGDGVNQINHLVFLWQRKEEVA